MTAIVRWTAARLVTEARKRHVEWLTALDEDDRVAAAIADARYALTWKHIRRAEHEEQTRPTWPRISIREVIR